MVSKTKTKILKPTSQRKLRRDIYGFDIETYGRKNKFYCATLTSDDKTKTYKKKQSLIDDLLKIHKNSLIVATNLPFDFFGTFDDTSAFKFLFRGSDLIHVKTYIDKKNRRFSPQYNKNNRSITFLDTLSYVRMSVKEMGKILKLPKLPQPKAFARLPKNKEEENELLRYNIRDAVISLRFFKMLNKTFYELGATTKETMSQTSLSLWRNGYQVNHYIRQPIPVLKDGMSAFYGGRTEMYKRTYCKNYKYFDFNSLYPSLMVNPLPNPNTGRTTCQNTKKYIMNFDGISDVKIYHPYMKIPMLPFRTKEKLLFPYGVWRGWYTHIELRKLIEMGGKIIRTFKTHYYTKNCEPFKEYIPDLYKKRQKYKSEGSEMQLGVKLAMNCTFGKFAQKFDARDRWIPQEQVKLKDIVGNVEKVGKFYRFSNIEDEPPAFCIPVWANHITAMGRLKLWEIANKSDPVYCDTDSIITKKDLGDSNRLGELKLEYKIKEAYFYKPKMYAMRFRENGEDREVVKIKGCAKRMSFSGFRDTFINNPTVKYNKISKFKESLRRNFSPNEIIQISKTYSLEDTKRVWGELDHTRLNDSEPRKI